MDSLRNQEIKSSEGNTYLTTKSIARHFIERNLVREIVNNPFWPRHLPFVPFIQHDSPSLHATDLPLFSYRGYREPFILRSIYLSSYFDISKFMFLFFRSLSYQSIGWFCFLIVAFDELHDVT